MKTIATKLTFFTIPLVSALLCPTTLQAKDTDIYLTAQGVSRDDSPNVLIILDNSGSMDTVITAASRLPYNPSVTYATQSGSPGVPSGRIYWSTTGSPPNASSNQWFSVGNNNCEASKPNLNSGGPGVYGSVKIVAFKPSGGGRGWRSLQGNQDWVVDCQADNGGTDPIGYLKQSALTPFAAYTSTASQEVNWNGWSGSAYFPTLYNSNYMNYIHNNDQSNAVVWNPAQTRWSVAQAAVKGMIDANHTVRFGLMVFNENNSTPNGGRVVMKVDNMDDARRTAMKNLVDSLSPYTYTPLSETLWEAYRYLGGKGVDYGNDEISPAVPRDLTAESGGTYISPFLYGCQQAYIIYVTDGDPTNDDAANTSTRIAGLPGIGTISGNPLDELAGWMYNNDVLNPGLSGTQRVITYTVGFGGSISASGLALLQATATKGHGRYYTADDADQLVNALQGALTDILSITTSFVAPALSINAFNQLFNRDDIYLALFKAETAKAWDGNIKKYRLCTGNEGTGCVVGEIVDRNNIAAVDSITNRIKGTASSFWNTVVDGNDIHLGGAGAKLPAPTDPPGSSDRRLYTYTGGYDADGRTPTGNTDLGNATNAVVDSNGNLTAAMLGAVDAIERTKIIRWMRGTDTFDEDLDSNVTETRWAVADPIHSRPAVVNYGGTQADPIIKLIVGTNDGALRMINEKTGVEEWSFVPKELLGIQKELADNDQGDHLYGLDGTPTVIVRDRSGTPSNIVNTQDGIIDPSIGDYVYVYIGMRRGGNNIYAIDVTPTSTLTNSSAVGGIVPRLKWVIRGGTTAGFGSLAQTWSRPLATYVRFGTATVGQSTPRLVLIFAGGYDTINDGATPAPGGSGNAIYMVDPDTGERLWWASGSGSGADLPLAGMDYSIPSDVALLDGNGDGNTDRIYVGDLAGQIWRIDLSPVLKKDTNAGSSGYVFADLGCPTGTRPSCTGTTLQERRKFYFPPDVAQVYDAVNDAAQAKHDLVAIASGDREDPLDFITRDLTPAQDEIRNRIYVLRDYLTDALPTGGSMSYPATLKDANLYNATANDLQDPNADRTPLRTSKGWYINLQQNTTTWIGEKSLARSRIFAGVLYVNTFTPANATSATAGCSADEGVAMSYQLNLRDGTAAIDTNGDGTITTADRAKHIGGGIPPETVIIVRDPNVTTLTGVVSGQTAPRPDWYKTFWYEN